GNGTIEGGYITIRVVDGGPNPLFRATSTLSEAFGSPAFTRPANGSELRRGLAEAGGARLQILNGYTEVGRGVDTAPKKAVCEETGLAAELMAVQWDEELGAKCGETWASRGTTLSC